MPASISTAIILLAAVLLLLACPGPASTGNSGDGSPADEDGEATSARPSPEPGPSATPAPATTPEPTPDQGSDPRPEAEPSPWDQVLVKPAAGVDAAALQAALLAGGLAVVDLRPSSLGWFLATIAPADPPRGQPEQEALAERARLVPQVRSAEPNRQQRPAATP